MKQGQNDTGWPLLFVPAMVLVAGYLKLQSLFAPSSPAPAITNAVGTTSAPISTSTPFGSTLWALAPVFDPASSWPQGQTKTYTLADLKINNQNDALALRQYALDLRAALNGYTDPNAPDVVSATMAAYEKQDDSALATISASKQLHDDTLTRLLTVSVPSDLAPYHLALVNSVSHMSLLAGNMSEVQTNPLLALTSARVFGPEVKRLGEALTTINGAFEARGLKFGANDGAKIYLNVNR